MIPERDVCALRDFVLRLVSGQSPVAEAELEEVARAALRGGYRLDIPAFEKAERDWRDSDPFGERPLG